MHRRAFLALTVALVIAAGAATALALDRGSTRSAAAAGPVPRATADRFDAARAWALVRRQLRYGQRPAGSPQLRRLARVLRARLPHGHFDALSSPGMRNVVGSLPGTGKALVIGAHYDTLAVPKGFVGANNGAAGTAIVVELARVLGRMHRPAGAPPIRFVLFDGEEPPGLPEHDPDFYHHGLRGSRADARAHAASTRAMILLDYVGGRGLRLPREGSSTPALWAQVRGAAAAVGAGRVFPDATGETIYDDHTPYLRAGVPAVDLIDWSYPGHTLQDGLDRLSPRSLDAVGETLVELVRRIDAAPGA
jgi:glutaminyl-peptide cyclotransferase